MLRRLVVVGLLTAVFAVSPVMQDYAVEAAATKKKQGGLKNRSAYTAEQRQKILEEARKICRKRYGAPANVYRIDYASNKIWCSPN